MSMRLTALSVLFVAALDLAAQSPPRRTECLQWDQAYAQMVTLGIAFAALIALAFSIGIGFVFGRRFWFATRARRRIWIGGGFAFLLAEFLIVAWPRILPLGKFPYASIDPRYPACQTISFGATGLLGGAVGQGVAAYAQWEAISLLLGGAVLAGTLIAFIFSEALVKSGGLEAIAGGGES